MEKITRVSFAAPGPLQNFLAFLYASSFITHYNECPNLLTGFRRVNPWDLEAPVSAWKALFEFLDTLESSEFMNRTTMLAYAVYVHLKSIEEFKSIELKDRVMEDDPVLVKRGLFEVNFTDITGVE